MTQNPKAPAARQQLLFFQAAQRFNPIRPDQALGFAECPAQIRFQFLGCHSVHAPCLIKQVAFTIALRLREHRPCKDQDGKKR